MTLNSKYVDWRFGIALIPAGRLKTGYRGCARPLRLDPFDEPYASFLLAFANYMLEQYSKALALLRDFVAEGTQIPACHALLAATLVRTGQLEEARAEAAEVLRTRPRFIISGSGGDLPPSAPH
jgi:adenylate cyclase